MGKGWPRPAGWALATCAVIGLSAYGVHSVLAAPGGDTDVPAAAPHVPAPSTPGSPAGLPDSPGVPDSPAPSASPSPTRSPAPARDAAPTVRATPSPGAATPVAASPAPVTSAPAGTTAPAVRTYRVAGGTVVLDVGAASARLVSRTAGPGWTAQTWRQDGWLRVDFTQGRHVSGLICSWDGHPPVVRTFGV